MYNMAQEINKNQESADIRLEIRKACDSIKELLINKNLDYGDSALNPANIFAKGTATENLCARIDDKLMRVANKGLNINTYDTVDDLIGYLVLLKVAIKKENYEINSRSRANVKGEKIF